MFKVLWKCFEGFVVVDVDNDDDVAFYLRT